MKKILIKINNDKELAYCVDGYILGINAYSFSFEKTYDVSEIKQIKNNNPNKLIFVSFNRLILDSNLEEYKSTLRMIDEIGVNGIIVGDIAALTYNLKTDIILDQMHLNNNHYTINHYLKSGVKGVILTNDITQEEIKKIRNKTKAILFKQVFGYCHLSSSKRMLVSNYKSCFSIENEAKYYKIKEKNGNKYYNIIEDDFGCHIYSDVPINLLGINLDVDYVFLDNYLIGDIKEVVQAFVNNDTTLNNKINEIYHCNTGFINENTFYKVKQDER